MVKGKKKFKLTPQLPSESDDQKALFDFATAACGRHPEIALMYAIPNGIPIYLPRGPLLFKIVNAFKARGLRPGFPDIGLPVQRIVDGKRYAGLFIEMKNADGGVHGRDQDAWIEALRKQGYKAEYCHGFRAAAELIVSYLLGEKV